MRKHLKTHERRNFDPATVRGPNPGDFAAGSLQSRAAARARLANFAEMRRMEEEPALKNLTGFEQAMIEDVDKPLVKIWMIRLLRVAQERAKVYERDLPLPTPKEIRRNRAVAKETDWMAG